MAQIKLNDTHYVDPETIALIGQRQCYGEPCVEVLFTLEHLESLLIRGEQAVATWANWLAFMEQTRNN